MKSIFLSKNYTVHCTNENEIYKLVHILLTINLHSANVNANIGIIDFWIGRHFYKDHKT
jgi:hypothetical protein